MQPYIDGMLSEEQIAEAKEHLERCPHCDKRFRFEEQLRHWVSRRCRRADDRRAAQAPCGHADRGAALLIYQRRR